MIYLSFIFDFTKTCHFNREVLSRVFSLSESNPGVFTSLVWLIWAGETTAITVGYGPKQLVQEFLREIQFQLNSTIARLQ